MSSSWLSPKTWVNATLDWILRSISKTPANNLLERYLGVESQEQASQAYDKDSDDVQTDFSFLMTISENDQPLQLINQKQFDQEQFDQEQFDEPLLIDDPLRGYADSLLTSAPLDEYHELTEMANSHMLHTDTILNHEVKHSNPEDILAISHQEMGINQPPQQIQRVKLRDEDREKAKRRRRRKRRKEARKKKHESQATDTPHLASQATYDQQVTQPSSQPQPKLNTWRRPPLRSLSKWEKIGYAQITQWQCYSPSSKALLFGSWFASLDSLVQVHEEMIKERSQFYNLVADHEEFSTFSSTELDAWWFQLNRVDHFVTEYQFYKRIQTSVSPVLKRTETTQPIDQDQDNLISDNQTINDGPTQSADSIQAPSPPIDIPIQVVEASHYNESPIETTQNQSSRGYSIEYSVDASLDNVSIDEDVILRPIKRRRRQKKSKSKSSS
jgi:hypothetical protein